MTRQPVVFVPFSLSPCCPRDNARQCKRKTTYHASYCSPSQSNSSPPSCRTQYANKTSLPASSASRTWPCAEPFAACRSSQNHHPHQHSTPPGPPHRDAPSPRAVADRSNQKSRLPLRSRYMSARHRHCPGTTVRTRALRAESSCGSRLVPGRMIRLIDRMSTLLPSCTAETDAPFGLSRGRKSRMP